MLTALLSGQYLTVIVGTDIGPGLVVTAVNVVPPASSTNILLIADHLQTVLLLTSVGFTVREVGEAPGLVVNPAPSPLYILVSPADEDRVVEVRMSCNQCDDKPSRVRRVLSY